MKSTFPLNNTDFFVMKIAIHKNSWFLSNTADSTKTSGHIGQSWQTGDNCCCNGVGGQDVLGGGKFYGPWELWCDIFFCGP